MDVFMGLDDILWLYYRYLLLKYWKTLNLIFIKEPIITLYTHKIYGLFVWGNMQLPVSWK